MFAETDTDKMPPVAIIDQEMANRFLAACIDIEIRANKVIGHPGRMSDHTYWCAVWF